MKFRMICMIVLLLSSACANSVALSPTATAQNATPTITPSASPIPSPTEASTPTPITVDVNVLFQSNPDFAKAVLAQDPNAAKDFTQVGDKYDRNVNGTQTEMDPSTAAVNVDIYGHKLTVTDSANPNPLTIKDKQGNIISYVAESKIYGADSQGNSIVIKDFPAQWFQVIKPNHPVDMTASQDQLKTQLETAISDPVQVTIDQVQSGELAQSVLLSGLVQPFPKGWKYTGFAINKTGDSIYLYTSKKIFVPFFAETTLEDGTKIGIREWKIWNPSDLTGWNQKDFSVSDQLDHSQILLGQTGVGQENLTQTGNQAFVDAIMNDKNLQPNFYISAPDQTLIAGSSPMTDQPSILALKNLPGNDPTQIGFVNNQINDAKKHFGDGDWQTINFSPPLDLVQALQSIVWEIYFS